LGLGLRSARCHLLGGETAVVPDLVRGLDAGGTAIGFFPGDRRPILGRRIRAGDVLLGIPSDGLHANGYTLLRKMLEEAGTDLERRREPGGPSRAQELLTPTRIYARPIEAIADDPGVHGLAHISGGGVRNLMRLRSDVRFELAEWPAPPVIFRLVMDLGRLSDRVAYGTFNMGIGFVVVTARRASVRILSKLRTHGARDARPVG